jgi:hypothetical protein
MATLELAPEEVQPCAARRPGWDDMLSRIALRIDLARDDGRPELRRPRCGRCRHASAGRRARDAPHRASVMREKDEGAPRRHELPVPDRLPRIVPIGKGPSSAIELRHAREVFIGCEERKGHDCAAFLEAHLLSSELVAEATRTTFAWWESNYGARPGVPLTTEVDPNRTRRKRDPGRCFRRAGWTVVGPVPSHQIRGAIRLVAPGELARVAR